ncbi:hypothetical protein ACFXB3_26375 [Streptomyces sp. NPDC059447]|uniref:hypothetical protein n=1 Tax=Streptomyces sp. NPDC059447 TaxID=3346834 RepID=UPI00367A3508
MKKKLTLLAACGLMAAGLAAAPANAADPGSAFTIISPAQEVLPPHPGTGAARKTSVAFRLKESASNGFVHEVTFSIDLSGLKGVADVALAKQQAGHCTLSATAVTCKENKAWYDTEIVALELTAAKDAKLGATADLTMTGTSATASYQSATTRLKIGGADLVMEDAGLKKEMVPGRTQALPLVFSNKGTEAVPGVSLRLRSTRGIGFVERYDNCTYSSVPGDYVTCAIEGEIKPGATYETVEPTTVKAGSNGLFEWLDYAVVERDTGAKPAGTSGASATGKKLTIRERAAKPSARSVVELNPADNSRELAIRVQNTADLAATPISLKGKKGEKVKADVKVRNNGPAGVNLRPEADEVTVDIRVPAGAKVTRVPMECNASNPDGSYRSELLGAPRYECPLRGTYENFEASFVFDMTIEEVVQDATGWVGYGLPGAKGVSAPAWDPKKDNNTAAFVINAKDGGSTPTPTPTPTTTATPAPTGSATPSATPSPSATASGGLAVTGSSAGPLMIGGAALVAVGGALVLAFRRRAAGRA